jgi:hypothetical protein
MNNWKELLDTLNTPGGHILILLMLVVGMTAATAFGVPKADDMCVGSFGALLAILSGKISNTLQQRDSKVQPIDQRREP